MSETLDEIGWGWVAWKSKSGWSKSHVVIGADTVSPDDCTGYATACGKTVVEDATEYADYPTGRTWDERGSGLSSTWRAMDPTGMAHCCNHCKTILEREGTGE